MALGAATWRLVRAALLGRAVGQQFQASLDRRQAAGDRRHHVRQVLDRRDQHQHCGDEGHEAADGRAAAAALPQRDDDHRRQRHRGEKLGHRRHRAAGRDDLEQHPAQRQRMLVKAAGLGCGRTVQSNDTPGQHVFFDHIGQRVGRLLALTRQSVQPFAHAAHQQRHGGEQHADEQREPPVQPQQIGQQGQQRQRILDQREDRVDQLGGAGLHFVDQGVGQAAGRSQAEHRGLAVEDALEQRLAQRLHTAVGGPGQGVLRDEARRAAQREDAHDRHRHHPQRQLAGIEALVEQGLHQFGDQRLGGRADQRADEGHDDADPAVAKVRGDAGKALQQGGHGLGRTRQAQVSGSLGVAPVRSRIIRPAARRSAAGCGGAPTAWSGLPAILYESTVSM